MTTKLRATVFHAQHSWAVRVELPAGVELDGVVAWIETSPSHPEAMQAAYKLLADIDAQLMAEVHASRSRRHTAKNDRLKAETIA